jgi:hypothetical protein
MGGTRIGLGAVKETLNSDATTISRTMSMKSGTIFYAWTSPFVNSRTGKNWALNQPLRTEAMTGRLRLVRSGADWYYAASEAVDGEFKYFARFLFGAEDVRQFRIIGMTGGENASLDVRVTDLRIRADAIPNMPDHPPRPVRAVEDPQQVGGKGWWAAGVLIGLAIVFLLALALGAWLYFRKRGFA